MSVVSAPVIDAPECTGDVCVAPYQLGIILTQGFWTKLEIRFQPHEKHPASSVELSFKRENQDIFTETTLCCKGEPDASKCFAGSEHVQAEYITVAFDGSSTTSKDYIAACSVKEFTATVKLSTRSGYPRFHWPWYFNARTLKSDTEYLDDYSLQEHYLPPVWSATNTAGKFFYLVCFQFLV